MPFSKIASDLSNIDARLLLLEKILIHGNGTKPYLSSIPVIEERLHGIEKRLEQSEEALNSIPGILMQVDDIKKGMDKLPDIYEKLGSIQSSISDIKVKKSNKSALIIGIVVAIVTVVGTAIAAL